MRTKPFTFYVMIINGNGQETQVCNILILNTKKNVACLKWHVSCHLTKKIEISPKKIFGGLATLHFLDGDFADFSTFLFVLFFFGGQPMQDFEWVHINYL